MAALTHAQQFANHTLPAAIFAAPTALTTAVTGGESARALAAIWEQAGAEMAPIARMHGKGLGATLERRGLYTTLIVTPPSPCVSGDPAAIVIIGRGDGVSRLSSVACYVLELVLDAASGLPRFSMVARAPAPTPFGDGPLPDPQWLVDHAFALYAGRMPSLDEYTGIPTLPAWYWWYALDGANAMRSFAEATDEAERFEAVRKAPVLLLSEIVDAADVFVGGKPVRRLRELQPYLRRGTSLGAAYLSLAQRLASTSYGSAVANAMRAIPLITEAREHGALTAAQAYEQEALIRSRLVVLGVDPQHNHALAQELMLAAQEAARGPRVARGSTPPPLTAEDPVWRPLFLDESDLPHGCVRGESDEAFSSTEPSFVAHGGLRAGFCAWYADETSAMARVIDARWVFRSTGAAAQFMRTFAATFGDNLFPVSAPDLGDQALAFGGEVALGGIVRRAQIIAVRVGRVIARMLVIEGAQAAASRQILHSALLHPIAQKMVQRARRGLAAYWLAVAYPTNTVAELVHSPGHDAARLLDKHPLLGLSELPAALSTLGDPYGTVARSLASFQAQVRAHRWMTYRGSMLSLVRMLLDTDMGDPRVNTAHAHEIVNELRALDPDPIWHQLDAECRARG